MDAHQLDAVFGALADPTRRAILTRLAQGDATVAELAAPFSVSQPAISRHLKVLEKAGLISRSREQEDRRLVATRLTKKGRELVDELDPVVARQHKARLGHLSDKQLATLTTLLTLARNPR